MDFRTCPLCKASVLDDDAEDCPSCGASLNGKPTAAKAPAAKAPPAKPAASRPASAATPAKAEPAKPGTPAARTGAPAGRPGARPGMGGKGAPPVEDDNPFDIDVAALQKVPKASPKPVKGATVQVTCPMCETKGFIPPTLQGKDVKCANPDCKVPIFKTPLPKREVADPNAGKGKGLSKGMLAGIGVLGVAVIAGAIIFLTRDPRLDDPGAVAPVATRSTDQESLRDLIPETNTILLPARAGLKSLAEIQAESLKDLEKNAIVRDNPNRALPRMWAAEALAMVGQIDGARNQLKALASVAGGSPFYKIQPLAQIALNRRTAAPADAEAALKEALEATKNLPESSRRPLDAVSDLASALVIMDRAAEAQTLLAKPVTGSRAWRSLYWSAATMGQSYRYDVVESIPAWTGSSHPQWAAVTWITAARGEPEKALAWAKSASAVDVRDSGLGVWAARIGLTAPNTSAARQQVEAAVAGESPAARAQAWANFAFARKQAGDDAGAKSALTQADAALGEIPAAAPRAVPDIVTIHDSERQPRPGGLPDPAPMRSAALAAASVARAHQALSDSAGAAEFLRSALAHSASASPSRSETQRLLDECENNRSGVQDRLDQALSLKGNRDRRFAAFNQYRRQCDRLNAEAQARFDLEQAILADSAGHGLTAAAWELLKERQQASDAALRQPYFQTKLPGYIAFRAYGVDQATYKDIEASFPPRSVPFDRIDEVVYQVEDQLKAGKTQGVYNLLKQIHGERTFDHDRLDSELLRVLSVHTQNVKSVKAFDFIWQLSGDALRGDALWLLGADSVRRGEAIDLWAAYAEQRRLPPTDRTAITRGFVDGIVSGASAGDKKLAKTPEPR